MKNKRILIVYLLISALAVGCLSVRAQEPAFDLEPIEVFEKDNNAAPLAQYEAPTPIKDAPVNYQNYSPTTEPTTMEKYGLVGFSLFTSLSLVVYVVKKDRETISEQNESTRELTKAITDNTSATKELVVLIQGEIRQMASNMNLRFDALDRAVERNNGNGA